MEEKSYLIIKVNLFLSDYIFSDESQGFPQEFLKACCFETEGVGAGGVTPPA